MRTLLFSIIFTMIPSLALGKSILTTIKPIQMIVLELTDGVAKPDVLLSGKTSPHGYALRPSDIKRIQDTDLMIWYGRDLEPFLEKLLENKTNVLTLSKIPELKLKKYHRHEHHHHGYEEHHGHEHHHGSYDPHFWLGKEPTIQVARAIADKLREIDPKNKAKYEANFLSFSKQFKKVSKIIGNQLNSIKDKGYYVFHDAYSYFEIDYSLNHLGHFTVEPTRKPGARTLSLIHADLVKNKAVCVFSEPQFVPDVVYSITRGTNVNIGVLDPIGSNINVEKGSYFVFLKSLAHSFSNCLSK
ncbi:zinc ABC transporter substrate-binding protein ZnuA [Candidatus Photodesmus anomalopis]|nr:zinc ABC transporter substrate-binding protein ZnuA [Candidatus Photodesmus katoptron]